MNAQEAFKLSQENWAENEQKNLSYIIGFQQKVEEAARRGDTQCMVASIPSGQISFTASFFEQMGYFVNFHQAPVPNECLVVINWKQEPLGSRPYKEANEFSKMIS